MRSNTTSDCSFSPLQDFFHRAVARTPDAWAVEHGVDRRSYAALALEIRRLAAFLQARGCEPESRVGLALPRGCEQVVGLLAILEAGGVCVPLDPTLPASRLEAMITDAGLTCVLAPDGLDLPVPRGVRVDPSRQTGATPPFAAPVLHADKCCSRRGRRAGPRAWRCPTGR